MQGNNKFRIKALCIFDDGEYTFISESYDTVKKDYFYRPIGGSCEFGEYAIEAIHREVKEELNTTIKNVKLEMVVENIFVCDGENGHEIDFIYKAEFEDKSFYEKKDYTLRESNGLEVKAFWMHKNDIKSKKVRLVPEQLVKYYE